LSPLLELTVTDIRQHVYCPRVPYYRYTLPLERPVTAKMDLGKEEHESTSAKEARRTLTATIITIDLNGFYGRSWGDESLF
jgi:CRISPR-associated exonuclease Cas4